MRKLQIGFLTLLLCGIACSSFKSPLPQLGTLPDFHLTDQNNQSLTLVDLKNRVWVANFIFTSCAGTCPMLTQRMKRVQDALVEMGDQGKKYHIVSFSVDPETDTPERLSQYAKQYGARAEQWSFLTGPLDQVSQTVVQGFKITMGKGPRQGDGTPQAGEIFDILHGEKFVLVDQQGNIRGYYDSDGDGIARLISDMKSL